MLLLLYYILLFGEFLLYYLVIRFFIKIDGISRGTLFSYVILIFHSAFEKYLSNHTVIGEYRWCFYNDALLDFSRKCYI